MRSPEARYKSRTNGVWRLYYSRNKLKFWGPDTRILEIINLFLAKLTHEITTSRPVGAITSIKQLPNLLRIYSGLFSYSYTNSTILIYLTFVGRHPTEWMSRCPTEASSLLSTLFLPYSPSSDCFHKLVSWFWPASPNKLYRNGLWSKTRSCNTKKSGRDFN